MASSFSQDYYYYNGECVNCCINMTYERASLELLYSRKEIFYTQFVLPLLLFLGFLDNTAFVYVVAKQSSMKTATNVYLLNLAISDILFLSSAILPRIWTFLHSPFVGDDTALGPIGCIIVPLMADAAYFSSLFFVTLVALQIFFAVCHPKQRSVVQHRIWSMWFSAVVWAVAILMSGLLVPSNSGMGTVCFAWKDTKLAKPLPTVLSVCGSEIEWLSKMAHVVQTVPFFVTSSFNIYLYIRIILALHRSLSRLRDHAPVKRDKDTSLRNQIARMLVVNGSTFFVLLAPFEVISFLKAFIHLDMDHYMTIFSFSRGLMYLNSVVNPVIYTAMSKQYREAFINVICKHTNKCRPSENDHESGADQQNTTQNYTPVSQMTTKT